MSVFIKQHASIVSGFSLKSGWAVLGEIEARIKAKIESIGIPLRDWDIQINYGIKTGFNEAFIINEAKRKQLLNNCPEAAEIIRPILRGRDIKKYNINFADQWIINTHNGIKDKKILPINAENDYPIIFDHLMNYKDVLINRLDKGNHWSNLRNCAYLEDFEKEKIVWIELTDHPNFALDNERYYLNNTIFFMTGVHLKYLLAFLNSRLCEWYFDKIAATSGAGTRRWIKMYIDQICVPLPNIETESKINPLVEALNTHVNNQLIDLLDNEIYKIFALSDEEIELINTASL